MAARRNVDGFAAGLMLVLCMIWGLQQVAIKAAAHDIVPIMQVGLRSGISASLVAIFMLLRRERFTLKDGTLLPGLVAGTLFAAEFLFVAKGLEHTSASHMAIFLYTSPVFTALGLHLKLPAERLTPRQWLGTGIAFGGIVTAFAGGFLGTAVSPETLKGDFFGILAGAAWGVTTVVIRCSTLSDAPPAKTLIYQLATACAILLAYAAATGQSGAVTMTSVAWGSLIFQAVIVSFASYLAWFWLLTRYFASRLSAFSFMTPLFGVSFGVILLHEPIDRYFAVGAALVLSGITLVSLRSAGRSRDTVPGLAGEEA
ncbi:DMT family transporter [Geomonas sp. RF6]|uniref:DMT family transporter n=1 Tax=Geomonas sp. RF6 TaxID=2897342 RepID=UPI001E3940DB|nr:DMT family transporter [Geomonas sp. RF6]UFS71916.1 DMT family transporter [Geomonas sp. RF6]